MLALLMSDLATQRYMGGRDLPLSLPSFAAVDYERLMNRKAQQAAQKHAC